MPSFLCVDNISKIFPDGTCALQDISFSLDKGDFLVIGGSNGSGKSVLMSIIASLDEPSDGIVSFSDENNQHMFDKCKKLKKSSANFHIGLVFQDADAQIMGETPEEDVAFALHNIGLSKSEITEKVRQALDSVGLSNKSTCASRFLSGGEKRRLAVASILAMESEIIIFDEPFANLDWIGVCQVCDIMSWLKSNGKTVIVLTHELEKIIGLANRFIVLDCGKIRFDGTPIEGLTQNLEEWGIKNPLCSYGSVSDLFWGKKVIQHKNSNQSRVEI